MGLIPASQTTQDPGFRPERCSLSASSVAAPPGGRQLPCQRRVAETTEVAAGAVLPSQGLGPLPRHFPPSLHREHTLSPGRRGIPWQLALGGKLRHAAGRRRQVSSAGPHLQRQRRGCGSDAPRADAGLGAGGREAAAAAAAGAAAEGGRKREGAGRGGGEARTGTSPLITRPDPGLSGRLLVGSPRLDPLPGCPGPGLDRELPPPPLPRPSSPTRRPAQPGGGGAVGGGGAGHCGWPRIGSQSGSSFGSSAARANAAGRTAASPSPSATAPCAPDRSR